jgi:hypothetical protein
MFFLLFSTSQYLVTVCYIMQANFSLGAKVYEGRGLYNVRLVLSGVINLLIGKQVLYVLLRNINKQ